MSNITKIYNKYKLTNSNEIFELIINLYLLECEYRNIFQIMREKIMLNFLPLDPDIIISIIQISQFL